MTPLRQRQLAQARELVLRYGWNASAYQILHPRLRFWFATRSAPDGAQPCAVIAYARHHGVRMVAGAPVCTEHDLPTVLQLWEAAATRHGDSVCYFGAGSRLKALLPSRQYASILLGAQPVWHPREWDAVVKKQSSLRGQIQRARNKNVTIERYRGENAPFCGDDNHSAPLNPAVLQELHYALGEWLGTRGLPPLHFLVEPQLLPHLRDRHLFVARRGGSIVAYLILTPVPSRRGWLVEQIVRRQSAPNGTTQLLIDSALRASAQGGSEYFTLGLTPLWQPAEYRRELEAHPLWLRAVWWWLEAHGRRFYNFEGLRDFKTRLQPHEWEPIYAISNAPRFSPRTLLAVIGAFSDRAPLQFAMMMLLHSLREEWQRFKAKA